MLLTSRSSIANAPLSFLFGAGTPVVKVLLGTPVRSRNLTNHEGFGHRLTPYPSTGRMLGQCRLQAQ